MNTFIVIKNSKNWQRYESSSTDRSFSSRTILFYVKLRFFFFLLNSINKRNLRFMLIFKHWIIIWTFKRTKEADFCFYELSIFFAATHLIVRVYRYTFRRWSDFESAHNRILKLNKLSPLSDSKTTQYRSKRCSISPSGSPHRPSRSRGYNYNWFTCAIFRSKTYCRNEIVFIIYFHFFFLPWDQSPSLRTRVPG